MQCSVNCVCLVCDLLQVAANAPSMYSQELFQLSQYLQVTHCHLLAALNKCKHMENATLLIRLIVSSLLVLVSLLISVIV